MSAPNITLPGAALRASAISLMGSGIGSVSTDGLIRSIGELMKAAVPGAFKIATKTYPLSEVESAWSGTDSTSRIVFKIP
jgi:hypothetical protein